MNNVSQQVATPNNMDSHFYHMTPKENQRKGPLLLDPSGRENIILIQNQSPTFKSPTLFKSELCIMSPGSNQDQSYSLIQKINSLHQESYFNSPEQKKRLEEYAKQMNEFEEIPQILNNFLELIENPHTQSFDGNEVFVRKYLVKSNSFFGQFLQIYILTIICLPYATATNSLMIYYVLLILRVIDVFLQIKLQCIIEKNNKYLPKTQFLQTIQYEIGQIAGILCLIFLTHTFIIQFLITIFVLLCFIPKFKVQELSIKLEFGLKDEQLSILLPIFRLCVYIHLLTCIWYGFNQDSDQKDNNGDCDYWDSLIAVVSIISFNNQTTPTQQHQKLYFTFISLSGLFILAYIIHQTKEFFGPLKQDLSQLQSTFIRMPVQLKLQIAQYCNHQACKGYANKKLILPSSITSKITFFQGYKMLKCCFPQYEEPTLAKCLDLCEEIEVQTEEKLLQEGQVDDCSIYFILQGKVKIVDRQNQMVFSRKEAGQCFGEYAFYTQHQRSATVMSDGHCKLLKLRRVDFLSCLSWQDKQFFQVEYEQMIFSNYYKWQCYCCHSHRHTINQCPKLTYRPQRVQVLTQYFKESENKRLNVRRGRIAKHDSAWVMREKIKVYENKMQYLHNDFYTPTSGLNSNCQLPYDENQRESVANQSSFQCDNQSFNQQLEKQEKKIEKVERNDHSQKTQLTAGFGHQFQSKFLVDSKMEIVNEIESLEAIDQQDLHKHEKSIGQSQMSNSPDCIETWVQQRGNQQNQKYRTTIRSLKSKSSKKQSTGTKSNFQSNFSPFSMFENFNNEDYFDQVYNFQFYRPQSNLEYILQILVNQNQ